MCAPAALLISVQLILFLMPMREFICIEVSDPCVFEELYSSRLFSDRCVSDARTAGLHATLHFLGETDETANEGIIRLLDATASSHRQFTISFNGSGAFPAARRPAVIWAGISDNEELREIHRELGEGLGALGIHVEGRAYKPHVTLARVRCGPDMTALDSFFTQWGDRRIGLGEVSAIYLKQSILSPSGATHRTIHASALCSR